MGQPGEERQPGGGGEEGEEDEEEEEEEDVEVITEEEAARRLALGEGGSRHVSRMNGERADPFATVHYGYVSELFSSPRFKMLRRGTRLAVLHRVLFHFAAALVDQEELPEDEPGLIRRAMGSSKKGRVTGARAVKHRNVWITSSWPKKQNIVSGTGVVTDVPEGGPRRHRLTSPPMSPPRKRRSRSSRRAAQPLASTRQGSRPSSH